MMRKQRIVADGVLWSNGKILMVKRASDAKFLPGYWEFPGGKVEYQETPEDALTREIHEECHVNVKILRPLLIDNFYIKSIAGTQFIDIFYLCVCPNDDSVVLNPEHSEYKWLNLGAIEKLKISKYLKSVVNRIKNHPLLPRT